MKNSLTDAINKLAKERDIELNKNDMDQIVTYINLVSNYIGKRAYHLMEHCNRRNIMLRDTKNALRIELTDDKMCENIIKFSNYIVSRFFQIQKGYSFELFNELFSYDKICQSKILLDLDIYIPFNQFKKNMKRSRSYTIQKEATIFLVSSIQSLLINILNSLKGYRKSNKNTDIKKVLNNYKCHSDSID